MSTNGKDAAETRTQVCPNHQNDTEIIQNNDE